MADRTDVQALMLQIDADVELLRQKLRTAGQDVERFASASDWTPWLVDRRLANLGRPSTGFAAHVRDTCVGISSIARPPTGRWSRSTDRWDRCGRRCWRRRARSPR